MTVVEFTDALICGAGPVGLLVGLGLAQQNVKSVIIEKRERNTQEAYGRACTLYPRTLELLESLNVLDDMLQEGFHGRTYAVYRDGKRVTRKAWQSMFPYMDRSFHNYILNIRQKYSENIFASKYTDACGGAVRYGWEITGYQLEGLGDGYNITATISDGSPNPKVIRCKYLVGSDGGNSSVRRMAGIEMQGNETDYRWVRIDGKIKTNMPETDLVFGALETKSHGNVLWAKLDRDASRIGFALTPTLQAKYPNGITQDEALAEAAECMKPFTFEMERLDWWTQYNVKQKVAETLQKDRYVLLAGDAAHTHSSAFAQGMNTGVHDATNLAWKLSGTIKGWYHPGILKSYSDERRAGAEKVVAVDRMAAAAVTGDIPVAFQQLGMSNEEALRNVMETNMSITTGLGVSYEPSPTVAPVTTATTLVPGTRTPDALLKSVGTLMPVRLYDVISRQRHIGAWTVLVFAGECHATKAQFISLRDQVSASKLSTKVGSGLGLATVIRREASSAWQLFDGPALGSLYYDTDGSAHAKFGIYPESGAVAVIRPDGVFAFAAALEEWGRIEDFFGAIFLE